MEQPSTNIPAFEKLSQFFAQYPATSYKDDQAIIQSGKVLNYVYFLEVGYVRQYVVSSDGQELTSHVYKPGSFFPLILSLNQVENRFYFSALTEVVVRKAPIEATMTFLRSEPDLLIDLSSRLLAGLNGLLHRLEIVTFGLAQTRVANGLLFFAKHFGSEQDGTVIVQHKFTHKNLAHFIGMSRETTSIELEKLTKLGTIQREGSYIRIIDLEELNQLASF